MELNEFAYRVAAIDTELAQLVWLAVTFEVDHLETELGVWTNEPEPLGLAPHQEKLLRELRALRDSLAGFLPDDDRPRLQLVDEIT